MVVNDPRKPTTKKKYRLSFKSANCVIAMPIQKHPRKLTTIIPRGREKNVWFFKLSFSKYLNEAPAPPPKAIYRILIIILLTLFRAQSLNYQCIE